MHPCLQRVSFPSWVSEDVLNQNHITRREDVLAPTWQDTTAKWFPNMEGQAGNKSCSYLLCFLSWGNPSET